jgi:hypothetical protein
MRFQVFSVLETVLAAHLEAVHDKLTEADYFLGRARSEAWKMASGTVDVSLEDVANALRMAGYALDLVRQFRRRVVAEHIGQRKAAPGEAPTPRGQTRPASREGAAQRNGQESLMP